MILQKQGNVIHKKVGHSKCGVRISECGIDKNKNE
jgi:hypothetical protein